MYNYNDITKELIEKASIREEAIFDYQFSPYFEEYEKYFQYCQKNLSEYCGEYNIQPARFFYIDDLGINARAWVNEKYYLIGVKKDTIYSLINLFCEKNNIFESDENLIEKYSELIHKFDITIGKMMFELAISFTYHHELAHLIQKSPVLSIGLNEQSECKSDSPYSIDRHILELDADINAAYTVCIQLIEYWKKLPEQIRTNINLQKILTLGTASVLCYFLQFYGGTLGFYLRKCNHPHPILRIIYVVEYMVGNAEHNLSEKINTIEIIRSAFQIADTYYRTILSNDVVSKFTEIYQHEKQEIDNYINELLELSINTPNLVRNRFMQ